ncbi:conserved hypothetical protein [Magnetococcus marinus MC-1]|uniref:Serine aminopeptidase S33 domain-containing protein n=1 Tax=Magnetococcus marinus (strain ATCC BAA-1437 / JCM 17883 / MC-1) TaxID=156889 RepID=A0L8K2_MAGMM|nr:alpha/beta fold hydrolase [Magnetococcus marinus]ABK44295.1 conserved hypothetical protein [Magnetococcus marinus MC-1]
MHWSLWLGTILSFYLGICLYMYLTQERQLFVPPRDWRALPSDWGLAYETVTLQSGNETLTSWFIEGDPIKPVVLFFHGNASNIGDLDDYAQLFHDMGYSTLLLEYRGYGKSSGRPSEVGLYADARAAWEYLTATRQIAPQRIVLFGHSLGGGPACWLAEQAAVAGLVLEGTFTSIPDRAAELYPWLPTRLLVKVYFPNMQRLARLQVPLLVVHSQEDAVIPIAHGRALYRAARGPKSMVVTQGPHDGGVRQNRQQLEAGLRGLEGRLAGVNPNSKPTQAETP